MASADSWRRHLGAAFYLVRRHPDCLLTDSPARPHQHAWQAFAGICHGRIQINISPGVPKPFAQIKAELLANWYSADAADGVDVDVCEVCDETRELVNGGRMCAPCAAINN
jgi:hypothetical protein